MESQSLFRRGYLKLRRRLPKAIKQRLCRGSNYFCPLCESALKSFLPIERYGNVGCPVCASHNRHRFLWLFLERKTDLFQGEVKKLLHFAPDKTLAGKLARAPQVDYLSGDLDARRAMLRMDITNISFPDSSFDVVLCSHVLEHVPDDLLALRQLHRVLKPGGWAVVMVPITVKKTFEDDSIVEPVEREKLFGQADHVRRYGPDIKQRIEQAGFDVVSIWPASVADQNEIHYYRIESEPLFYCRRSL